MENQPKRMQQSKVQQVPTKQLEIDEFFTDCTILHIKGKDFYPQSFMKLEVYQEEMAIRDQRIDELTMQMQVQREKIEADNTASLEKIAKSLNLTLPDLLKLK